MTKQPPIKVDFVPLDDLPLIKGRLGMTFAPGKCGPTADGLYVHDRDLNEDLSRLRQFYRTERLVSLIEDHELQLLQIEDLVTLGELMGIEMIRFPIVDVSIPDMDPTLELVANILDGLDWGLTTVVHCRGGLGRAGTITACTLVAAGLGAEDAIQRVREARPRTIETREQEDFVRQFEYEWR